MDSPWCTSFAFDPTHIKFPRKVLYDNFACSKPLRNVDLTGWRLNSALFNLFGSDFKRLRSLVLDHSTGLTSERLECIRGFTSLTTISFRKAISFDAAVSRIIASWPSLTDLDLSECQIGAKTFQVIALSCSELKKLSCQNCPGLDDLVLLDIADLVQRFRKLHTIDLSSNICFTDEGVLAVMVAGPNVIKSLNISKCRGLSTLAIAGLRKKMTVLETLDVNTLNLSVSAFEWIQEGCLYLLNLDLSKNLELDDTTLALIGRKCKKLEKLCIARCNKISDVGITGFVREFEGRLNKFDMSGCVLCGVDSAMALSKICSEFTELKLNGLSQISAESLKSLWLSCSKLIKFEMCAELRTTSSHRRSTMPHISDDILKSTHALKLKEIKLSGACLVTDTGACVLSSRCLFLTHVDVSYCNGITDKLLIVLSNKSKRLNILNVSGCNKIGDIGVSAVLKGCPLLARFEAAGCARITDVGVTAAPSLPNLEALNLRNCDRISDVSLRYLAKNAPNLRNLDVNSLDLVSIDGVAAVALGCRKLGALNCSNCNLTAMEFASAIRFVLPLLQPAAGKCFGESRSMEICSFNKYVLQMHEYTQHIKVVQRFVRIINARGYRKRLKELYNKSATEIQRIYRGYKGRIRFNKCMKAHKILYAQATRLQRAMRVLFGKHYKNEKSKLDNKRHQKALLIQKIFRGHASRKRSNIRKERRRRMDVQIVHKAKKILLKSYIMKLKNSVILLQRQIRRLVMRKRYLRVRHGIILLQGFVRAYISTKRNLRMQQRNATMLRQARKTAAAVISRNWRAIDNNKRLLDFVMDCAIHYSSKYDNENWNANNIQAAFRGFMARKRVARHKMLMKKEEGSSIVLQAHWRKYSAREAFILMKIRMRRIFKNFKILYKGVWTLYHGIFAAKIQRLVRKFLFLLQRKYACVRIQRVYRGRIGRLIWKDKMDQKKLIMAEKIQRQYRVFSARKHRKEMLYCQYFMAKRIQVWLHACILMCHIARYMKF